MDTSGFYKLDLQSGGIVFAPNFVHGPSFVLSRDDNESKLGEIAGWRWFESENEAYFHFNVQPSDRPWSISPLQARIALHRTVKNGSTLLSQVESFMVAAPVEVKIAWEKATEFRRNSPTLLALAQVLGLTDQELDDLFVLAHSIIV